jgi:adenylate cyclase
MTNYLPRATHWIVPLITLTFAIAIALSGAGGIAAELRLFSAELIRDLLARGGSATLVRPLFAETAELAYLIISSLAVSVLLGRSRLAPALLATLVLIVLALLVAWGFAVEAQLIFDPAYPSVSILCVLFSGLVVRFLDRALGRRQGRRALFPSVAAGAATTVGERPDLFGPKGQKKNVTYLVCHVRDYAKLADAYASDIPALNEHTRRLMRPLVKATRENGGTIDHLFAGGLTAFFDAGLDDPNHAFLACECALRMRDEVEKVNTILEGQEHKYDNPIAPIKLGIGINSGESAIGNFGTRARPECFIAGSAIEFARELAALSSTYGPTGIVGEETRDATERNFAYLEVDMVANGPKGAPALIFALMGNAAVRTSPKFRALETFHHHILKAYRGRDWDRAQKLIKQCRALSGSSLALYTLYENRIAYMIENPPAENWDGVFRPPQT